MEAFKQPILPDNPEQLRGRLWHVRRALAFWNSEKGKGSSYYKDFTLKNIDFFQTQKDNILKMLK